MNLKKVIIPLAILLVLGAAYAYYLFNKKVPGLENAKADYQLTADQLFDSFDENEADALAKYGDKVIEVTGEVLEKKETPTGAIIILKAENAMAGGVNCSFNPLETEIKTGQTVVVRGRCQGFLLDVILNNCVIVK